MIFQEKLRVEEEILLFNYHFYAGTLLQANSSYASA